MHYMRGRKKNLIYGIWIKLFFTYNFSICIEYNEYMFTLCERRSNGIWKMLRENYINIFIYLQIPYQMNSVRYQETKKEKVS